MGTESWVEDESHRTINGERWVARKCDGGCYGRGNPDCEFLGGKGECLDPSGCSLCFGPQRLDGRSVRWYRLGGMAQAFLDKPKEEPKPVTDPARPLPEICMDGIRSSLKTFFHDRDRRAVEIMRDIRANSLDARVQAAMDAMMGVPDGFATAALAPTPAPEPASATVPDDNVEIIIDPTPEQVPGGWLWCARWDEGTDMLEENLCAKSAVGIARWAWRHYAILVRGNIAPSEFCARVRKMLDEKEAEK